MPGQWEDLANTESLSLRKGVAQLGATPVWGVGVGTQHRFQKGAESISLGVRHRGPEAREWGWEGKGCMRQTLPHQAQILPRLELGLIILLLGQQQKNLSQREPSVARFCTEAWQL